MPRLALAPRHWALLGLLAAGAALLWRLHPQEWPLDRRLDDFGALAQGTVTAKGREGDVHYTFAVGDRLYSGVGTAGYGNPELGELAEGDSVVVAYLPSDPNVSILGSPHERLRDQNRAIALALLVALPALFFSLRRELGRFNA